tara:strand:+ start:114 stop:305 length:192 start_codon:yes stop_codon:yes gene_type:complete
MSLKYLRELTEKLISKNCNNVPCIDFKNIKLKVIKKTKEEVMSSIKSACEKESENIEKELKNV